MRYDDVLGSLWEAYDGRAAWRDAQPRQAWKIAEHRAFRERLDDGARVLEVGAGPVDADEHVPPRFFSWRTDEQLLAFAAACFDVVDFHRAAESDDGEWFQSLTAKKDRG